VNDELEAHHLDQLAPQHRVQLALQQFDHLEVQHLEVEHAGLQL
jgi:hypothetical protein